MNDRGKNTKNPNSNSEGFTVCVFLRGEYRVVDVQIGEVRQYIGGLKWLQQLGVV